MEVFDSLDPYNIVTVDVDKVLYFNQNISRSITFKIDIKKNSKSINVINGGRYDKLISDLGSKKEVPAVGAALSLNY